MHTILIKVLRNDHGLLTFVIEIISNCPVNKFILLAEYTNIIVKDTSLVQILITSSCNNILLLECLYK